MKTKHKKMMEAQKIKSKNARKLIVCCVSKNDSGKEVFTRVIGKNFSFNDVSKYALETYETDFKILDRENYFDYAEALHCWLTLNHDGQTSEEYALLSRSEFSPGPLWKESRAIKENAFYGEIEALSMEDKTLLMEELEALSEEDENADYVYMVSLYEISRKDFYGTKNKPGLKEFRGHSSHFLAENGQELDLGNYV